jgi:hypothetical protein
MPDTWVSATCKDVTGQSSANPFRGRGKAPAAPVMSDKHGRFELSGLERTAMCTVRAEEPFGLAGSKNNVRPGDDVTVPMSASEDTSGSASLANGLVSRGGPASSQAPQ